MNVYGWSNVKPVTVIGKDDELAVIEPGQLVAEYDAVKPAPPMQETVGNTFAKAPFTTFAKAVPETPIGTVAATGQVF